MTIQTRLVEYADGDTVLEGLLAWDDTADPPRPGVMVSHAWAGRGDLEDGKAHALAELGYVALAADMYGNGQTASTPDAAGTLMNGVLQHIDLGEARLRAGVEQLRAQALTDARHIAAIGYCFGGGVVLNMARMGTDIDGVVSFHASINTGLTAEKGDVKTRVLAIQGDGDPAAPVA